MDSQDNIVRQERIDNGMKCLLELVEPLSRAMTFKPKEMFRYAFWLISRGNLMKGKLWAEKDHEDVLFMLKETALSPIQFFNSCVSQAKKVLSFDILMLAQKILNRCVESNLAQDAGIPEEDVDLLWKKETEGPVMVHQRI